MPSSPAITPAVKTPACVDAVRRAAARLQLPHMDIVSGAGHDAIYIARVCPTAMIFVPCEGGISHNEIENAKPGDLAAGANVLLQVMLERAGVEARGERLEARGNPPPSCPSP